MGRLIHINGAPGVGKLTIARIMAPRLNARLLDNCAIYNVAWALTDVRSPIFYSAVRAGAPTNLPNSEIMCDWSA